MNASSSPKQTPATMCRRSQLRTSCAVDQTSVAAATRLAAAMAVTNLSVDQTTLSAAHAAKANSNACDQAQRTTYSSSIARRASTSSAGRQHSASITSVVVAPGPAGPDVPARDATSNASRTVSIIIARAMTKISVITKAACVSHGAHGGAADSADAPI